MHTRQSWQAHFASHILRQGGVLAHPTEAVWGLACDPFSEQAVERLLDLKGRPVEKGLILVSANIRDFDSLLEPLDNDMLLRFKEPRLRPTTWIVPDVNSQIPQWIRGKHSGVAVRVSSHPLVSDLTRYFGGPIISTSANPAGKSPAMCLSDVRHYFGTNLDYILSGRTGGHTRPSQIIDLASGKVLRD